jgi:hypothetical protein
MDKQQSILKSIALANKNQSPFATVQPSTFKRIKLAGFTDKITYKQKLAGITKKSDEKLKILAQVARIMLRG